VRINLRYLAKHSELNIENHKGDFILKASSFKDQPDQIPKQKPQTIEDDHQRFNLSQNCLSGNYILI